MDGSAVQFDVAAYAAKYVALRDKIKEIEKKHEAELAPFKAAKEQLNGLFLDLLARNNTASMRTAGGTISKTERSSATVEDMHAFRTYVTQMGDWDLVDFRANAPAVRDYAQKNSQLPPGVKYSAVVTVSVRRPNAKDA
jgi:hypothetical protein